MSFREYTERFKKYPIKIVDTKGNEIELVFTPQEHEEFLTDMDLIDAITLKVFYIEWLYGLRIDIDISTLKGKTHTEINKTLQQLKTSLDELLDELGTKNTSNG